MYSKLLFEQYIVGYLVANLVIRRLFSKLISNDTPFPMKILNMVIPMLMYHLTFSTSIRQ